jgi:hypothetical protein
MRPEELLTPTPAGLCCPAGGFHIDPLRAVDKALITHAHSDHARAGHRHVLATREALRFAPVDQRFLGPVRHPDLGRSRRGNCAGETVPVAMIGNDQRQFDAELAGARPHPHPTGGEACNGVGSRSTPAPSTALRAVPLQRCAREDQRAAIDANKGSLL